MSIIISNKPGQLGNRLILYAHFICFGAEYGIKVYNPSFDEYRPYFKKQSNFGKIFNRIYYIVAYCMARLLDQLSINNNIVSCKHIDWEEAIVLDKKKVNNFLFTSLCFIQGWKYRNNELLQKHRKLVLDTFEPHLNYIKQIQDYFNENFSANQVIIGVHIRRGDYLKFENGKYFYEFTDYKKFMEQVCDCFADKNLKFLISTNDKKASAFFNTIDLECVMAPGHELLDLYSLSKCHYIIGPPSTYTLWASLYGLVPLQMIQSKEYQITKDKFEIIRYF